MKTLISVIVPTNRVGGLDVLFESLARQTFQDFELVLCDAIYPWRREVVADMSRYFSFPVVHLPPWENKFPEPSYCRSLNVGIAHCRGPLTVYLCDYSYLSPTCLEYHWKFQERHAGHGLMLPYTYRALPALNESFPKYGPGYLNVPLGAPNFEETQISAAEAYERDLSSGVLKGMMWSLFKEPLCKIEDVLPLEVKLRHNFFPNEAPHDPNYCSLKNESIPTYRLVGANGHDEDFDGSHGWQDSEICRRIVKAGMTWWKSPGPEVMVVDPRPVFYFRKPAHPIGWNGELMKMKAGHDEVNPGYSLREIRKWTVPESEV